MRYFILVLFVILSCKTTSKTSQNSNGDSDQNVFIEVSRDKSDKDIRIGLKNTSDVSQSILRPMEKFIEQNIDGEWLKVGVLYCDCGGPPCPAPPDERAIEPQGVFVFTWDRMVEDCQADASGRTTIKTPAPAGEYRATISYKSDDEEMQVIINFTL